MFYGNVDDFKEYFKARGKEVPETWTDEMIESALLVSSEWLDNQFENSWIGYKVEFEQERSWPRQSAVVQSFPYHVYDNTEIPEQVAKATYEAAARHASGGIIGSRFVQLLKSEPDAEQAIDKLLAMIR